MKNRQQRQFLMLYEQVHERFQKFCRARAYHDMPCEDLVNETLLVAYKQFHTLRKEASFLSFLIGISIKILANHKKKNRPVSGHDASLVNEYADPVDYINRKADVTFLYQILKQLPEHHQNALILYEITGFSTKEIAELMSSTESAVRQWLSRGRKALTKIVESELKLTK